MAKNFPLLALVVLLMIPVVGMAEDGPPSGYHPPDRDFQWATSGGNIIQIATAARYIHHDWYGELGIGGLSAFENRENAIFLSLYLGRRFALIPRLYLGADIGYRHVIPDGSDNPDIDVTKYFTLEGRLKLEVVIGKHFSAFVGGGYNNAYQGYSLGSDTVGKTTIFWGVGLL
jgi:hypothetical protein